MMHPLLLPPPMASACRNADTLKRLQDTERLQKEQTEAAYINLDVSNEEKEKGNQVFPLLKTLDIKRFCLFWSLLQPISSLVLLPACYCLHVACLAMLHTL